MNNDLISRQAAIDGVKTLHDAAWKYWRDPTLSECAVLNMIEQLPSVQADNISEIVDRVVEQLKSDGLTIVKHGKWERGRCTECGMSLEDLFSGEFYYDQEELKFCPNCGADMRSKAREYLEYGELITKGIAQGIAQGLRGDSDE